MWRPACAALAGIFFFPAEQPTLQLYQGSGRPPLWGGAGALEGTHAGGRWGPTARRRRRFFGTFFFFFCAIFYLFSKEFAVLAAMLITPCDSLSALLTVPCCTIDHLHSSRP